MGNLQSLLFSLEGRIARGSFWLGVVILIVAGIVLSLILSPIFGVAMFSMPEFSSGSADTQAMMDQAADMTRSAGWSSLLTFIILIYPLSALMIKRRHDRGSAGKEFWAYAGLTAVLLLLQATGLGFGTTEMGGVTMQTPNILYSVVGFVVFILGVYLLVVCGFLKGNEGSNTFGPDPLDGGD